MPFEINLGKPPAGYALQSAEAGAEDLPVQIMEFTSTEDGQHFIKRLEGFPSTFLDRVALQKSFRPSQVEGLLAICRRDGTATVFLNDEIVQHARIRPNRPIEAGEFIAKDDIVEFQDIEFDVEIPDDAGILYYFSIGWRKGLYYDFAPISGPSPVKRNYNLGAILGQAYCHVLFQERFGISDKVWEILFRERWFPFAVLKNETIKTLIAHIEGGLNLGPISGQIVSEVSSRIPSMLENWKKHSTISSHLEFLARAVERFLAGDHLSCASLIYPRIEGILRTHCMSSVARPTQEDLAQMAVESKADKQKCLLMPHRFAAYLHDVYFANFNPVAQNIDVSRNSVAHGVADSAGFDAKSSAIGFLIVDQLFYFLEYSK